MYSRKLPRKYAHYFFLYMALLVVAGESFLLRNFSAWPWTGAGSLVLAALVVLKYRQVRRRDDPNYRPNYRR